MRDFRTGLFLLMPLFVLDEELVFPPAELALPDGLLAIGGDLSPERLLLDYQQGIFPWYEGSDILWWSPDPRFVLFPDELHVSKKTLSQVMKRDFIFSINKNFVDVIRHCKKAVRPGQDGTWITN